MNKAIKLCIKSDRVYEYIFYFKTDAYVFRIEDNRNYVSQVFYGIRSSAWFFPFKKDARFFKIKNYRLL